MPSSLMPSVPVGAGNCAQPPSHFIQPELPAAHAVAATRRRRQLLPLALAIALALALGLGAPTMAEQSTSAVEVLSGNNNYFLRVDLRDSRVRLRVLIANNDAGGLQPLSSIKNRIQGQGYAEWAIVNGDLFSPSCLSGNCAEGLTYIDGQDRTTAPQNQWSVRGNIGFDTVRNVEVSVGGAQTKRNMLISGGPRVLMGGGAPTCAGQWQGTSFNKTIFPTSGEWFNGNTTGWCSDTRSITMVGHSSDGRYLYMGASSGGQVATTVAQWLKDRGAHELLRMDSGGSSGMYHNNQFVAGTNPAVENRPIANALAVTIDNSPPTIIADCLYNVDEIVIYNNVNFTGNGCKTLGIGNYQDANTSFPQVGNDQTKSIRIGANVEAELCDGGGFGLPCQTIRSDTPNFLSFGVSSIRVRRPSWPLCSYNADQIVIYNGINYGGDRCQRLGVGVYQDSEHFPDVGNDQTKSVRVGLHVSAVLCNGGGFGAPCGTFNTDNEDVSSLSPSSIKVLPLLRSDLNANCVVDIFDLSILLARYATTDPIADINGNGRVDIFDLSILLSNYSRRCR
jgi:hypothetical protein